MQSKKSISAPKIGMNLDTHESQLSPQEYRLGVNINSSSEGGESFNVQNEPSNYFGVQFPENYVVVGFVNNLLRERTYFLLSSIETDEDSPHFKRSSIGYVDNTFLETFNSDQECVSCDNPKNVLGTPLEDQVQTPAQVYIELENDRCVPLADIEERGFNFDINFPIKKIEIKQEKLGTTLYWNDWKNPFRYLQIERLEEAFENNTYNYLRTVDVACEDPTEDECLNVEKLLVSPKHKRIILEADKEQTGGNLKQGSYEFWGAYCDLYGNEITEYSTPTNPISIWDENNYIQAQTETDDFTNYAIKLKVKNLDVDRFKYYKIAVVERNNVNNTQSVFLAGIYPTTDDVVVYTHSGSSNDDLYITRGNTSVKKRMDFETLVSVKPQFKRAKGTMVSDDRLFAFGLEEEEEINLQPVVNLFSGLVKAQTSAVSENLYKSSIATSKYKQYTRGEVQPLGIRLLYDDGGYSATFPFVGRPKVGDEGDLVILTSGLLEEDKKYVILKLNEGDNFSNVGFVTEGVPFIATGTTPTAWSNFTEVTNVNKASLIEGQNACGENTRQEKWQIFNTASLIDEEDCFDLEANSIELPPETIEKTCYIDIKKTIPSNTITLELNETFYDLESYIEDNPDLDIPEITPYLEAEYDETCISAYVGDCSEPTLIFEENEVDEVIGETQEFVYKEDEEYVKSIPPQFCNPYKRDTASTDGSLLEDTEFMNLYSDCIPLDRRKVYVRDSSFVNESCAYATIVPIQNNPSQSFSSVFLNYEASEDEADLLLDNASFVTTVVDTGFNSVIHNKAQFFKIDKNGRNQIVFEITKKSDCPQEEELFRTKNNKKIRYVIFDKCNSPTEITGGIIDLDDGFLITLDVSTYPESFIIAIDTKITSASVRTVCLESLSARTVYYVTPPCGCFGVYQRDVEAKAVTVSWDSITLRKKMVYEATCVLYLPKVNDCDPIPYKKYKMAYWESTVEYPDNKQLYDSSVIQIRESDLSLLSEADKLDFENYYTDGVEEGVYNLKAETDLRCSPIRHPKFPDNTVTPFMIDNIAHKEGADSVIFPMGINFDSSIVQTMIEVAYNNNLLTKKQKEKIVGWEIMKGDNSIHKSLTASGILYDVYKYTKDNNEIHFSNFPYNDLGENKFVKDPSTNKLIQHPFEGESNNKFTFLSPDMFLTKPAIPTEMSLQGYMFGTADISFADVKEHPQWTVLGRDAYTTAEILAGAELILESLIKFTEVQSQANQGLWVMGGFTWGTGATGTLSSTGLNAILIGSLIASSFIKFGEYRYNWLQIFRNLGRADNFASFQYGAGKHNKFLKIDSEDDNCLRKLSLRKHLRDGDFTFIDETNGSEIRLNHNKRENSVFLSTGNYNIEYPAEYLNYDNNKVSSTSSNFLASETDCKNATRNKRDIANPYVQLKNYIPDQWDTIDSIKWLTTNYIFDINEDTSCKVIYGGSQVISRFSWRVKTPLFVDNAIRLADKLPYLYSKNSNIGDTRFFCNYETAEDSTFDYLGVLFPDIRSEYEFDCQTGRNSFYLRPPSKFYLFTHGIVDFLVESEINCNFRYGRKEPKDQFYKNQNLADWLQEVNLPMIEPNTFYYNNTYTFPVSNTPYKKLDRTYDKEIWRKRAMRNNAWIWSEKDVNENALVDPWLIFRPLNFWEDKTNRGELIDLRSIESGQFLGRYENELQLFNQANAVADALNTQNRELGTGFLQVRPISFKKSDLGFLGTQNTDFVSTPYGHFFVDAKRGRVFQIDQNGQNIEIISEVIQGKPSGMKNWFREHLPFKILKQFPQANIDNKFKGLGINMWYDDRQSRVFITKRDYKVIDTECLNYNDEIGFYKQCDCPEGYTYDEVNGRCLNTACLSEFTINVFTQPSDCSAHACNAGTFLLKVNGVTIGDVFLSNTGGSEDMFNYPPDVFSGQSRFNTFTLTTEQVQEILENSEEEELTFSLECNMPPDVNGGWGIGNCHTSSAHMVIINNGEEVYDACPSGDTFSITPCTEPLIIELEKEPIYFDNEEYFKDVSWTISYKPTEGAWNSFFSFYPDYSIGHQNYFQVGYNFGIHQGTMWNHLMNNNSFGVFMGEYHPWILEFPISNENVNKILNSLSIDIEARRYNNQFDYSVNRDIGVTDMFIYNATKNSGYLVLHPQKTLADNKKYPYVEDGKQHILTSFEQGKQNVNYFYNRLINENNNVPMFKRDENNIFKDIDPRAVSFKGKKVLERLTGNVFLVNLSNTQSSQFQIIIKNIINNETVTG
jgi:hypothetical protein